MRTGERPRPKGADHVLPERAPTRQEISASKAPVRLRSIGSCVLAALMLATGAACGSDEESAPSSTESPPPTALSDEAADAQAGVSLADAGAELRQPLRLRVHAGMTTRMAMVNRFTMKMTADGEELPVGALPATRLVMEQRVDRVDPDGTIHYGGTFVEATAMSTPGVSPLALRAAQEALDDQQGLTFTGEADVRGGVRNVKIDTSRVTNDMLRSMLDSMTSQIDNLAAPFPSAAVGPGARWTAKSSATTFGGMVMNTTTHYTLRSREGDSYELDVTQEGDVPPGPFEIPTMPPSEEAFIERFDLTSTGILSGSLTFPLPGRLSMNGSSTAEFTMTAEGESGRLLQEMTTECTLEPA